MKRRVSIAGCLIIFTFLVSGCGTICGAAAGAAKGFKEDIKVIDKADTWVKENLW